MKNKHNNVCTFIIYMCNKWSEEECKKVFENSNCNWQHFWKKWCELHNNHGAVGAIPYFFLELSYEYQDLLLIRAVQCYDGRTEK